MFTLAYGLYDYIFSPPSVVVGLFGLDGAGKSTFTEQLRCLSKHQEMTERHIPPTIVNTLVLEKWRWTLWDLGGASQMRAMWKNYAPSADGLIFVIDGKDAARVAESRKELMALMENYREAQIPPLLVFINKVCDHAQSNENPPEPLLSTVTSWLSDISTLPGAPININTHFTVAYGSAVNGNGMLEAMARLAISLSNSSTT